jgi:hypothetical protein
MDPLLAFILGLMTGLLISLSIGVWCIWETIKDKNNKPTTHAT